MERYWIDSDVSVLHGGGLLRLNRRNHICLCAHSAFHVRSTFHTAYGRISLAERQISWKKARRSVLFSGDPDENRTRVTAVKGPCLNRLTTGPALMQKHQKRKRRIKVRLVGSGNWTRTSDTPGMNRMLYQLSYAAIEPPSKGQGLLYRKKAVLSREN